MVEMRRSPLAPRAGLALCPGQNCAQREDCLRYRRHAAPNQVWASWDIERQQKGGDCPAFDRIPKKGR